MRSNPSVVEDRPCRLLMLVKLSWRTVLPLVSCGSLERGLPVQVVKITSAFFFIIETQAELVPKPDGIRNAFEEVVDPSTQMNLEVDSADV
ncbi:hypothetical protein TNCV_3741461 [Trichonephila clavipes]|nr:hypothetical protein TNCV_3741461 [Trichonephila clavipes]